MEITSKTNTKVKQWVRYQSKKYRDEDKRFLIEGEHMIEEADKSGLIDYIIVRQGYQHVFHQYPCYECSDEVMDKISMNVSHVNVMACVKYMSVPKVIGKRLILLDQLQDPGNVGTIIRSAYSFGFDGVVLSNHSVDIYNEKMLRSTQGAIFHIPVWQQPLEEVIEECKKQKIKVYATSLHVAQNLQTIPATNSCALIFGNEGNGVSHNILALSDQNIMIEMSAFESLNVAVAAGICMYHFKVV